MFQQFFSHTTQGVSYLLFLQALSALVGVLFHPLTRTIMSLGLLQAISKVYSIKIAQTIRKSMDLLDKRSGAKMKSSRIQVFPSLFCWDILGVLAFTFVFVPMAVKQLVHLHILCLHTITQLHSEERRKFCIVHIFLTGGKSFPGISTSRILPLQNHWPELGHMPMHQSKGRLECKFQVFSLFLVESRFCK